MIKKTITYTDFNGVERTEDFYFHLSKAEIVEMELGVSGGMTALLNQVVAAQDNKRIFSIFKDIILKAYGEKSIDGKRFVKSADISEAFSQTQAFNDLFIELATNENAAVAFITDILPKA